MFTRNVRVYPILWVQMSPKLHYVFLGHATSLRSSRTIFASLVFTRFHETRFVLILRKILHLWSTYTQVTRSTTKGLKSPIRNLESFESRFLWKSGSYSRCTGWKLFLIFNRFPKCLKLKTACSYFKFYLIKTAKVGLFNVFPSAWIENSL